MLCHTCVGALLHAFRYDEAKDLAKNLEQQATKVQAEAQEAGDQALKMFANLTSLPPFKMDALEVTGGEGSSSRVRAHPAGLVRPLTAGLLPGGSQ